MYPLHWFFRLTGHTTPNPDIVDWKEVFKHLPLSTMDEAMGLRSPIWKEYLEHSTFDDYWKRMDLTGHFNNIDLPVLHITGWFDGNQAGQMFFYEGMAADSPAKHRQWLLIGPWDHAGTRKPALELGGLEFGKEAIVDMQELHRQWFDYWLRDRKDKTFEKQPKVKYFLTGENRWYEASTWPPPLVERQSWYLHSGGMANTMAGDGSLNRTPATREKADRYVYNPEFPVPTTPDKGVSYVTSDTFDQRYAERRDDVLCYTSETLERPLAIGGRVNLVFYAASDAPDTDFMAKLIDVHPDERALMLGPMVGVIRARFRDSLSNPTLLTPGTVYRYEIDLNHVGHTFLPGHRIRVELTSSNFPMHDRNPNTGAPIGKTTEMRLARQTIYHDADHPSALILPVLSKDARQMAER